MYLGVYFHRPAFCQLQHGTEALHQVEAHHRYRHAALREEVGREAAATEVVAVGRIPGSGFQAGVDVGICHLPVRFHHGLPVSAFRCARAVERGCAGVDEVDNAAGGAAFEFQARHALHGFWAPIGAHVAEYLCAPREQVAEKHGHAVERIVLGGKRERLAAAVPVERRVEQRLGEVAVGVKVCPLALPLEACGNGVVPQRLLLEPEFFEFRVAQHEVAHDERHLHHKFPVAVLFLARLTLFGAVFEVVAFVGHAVLFRPGIGACIFFGVVDALGHAADNFGEVDALVAHAEIFLEEVGTDDRAGDAHRHAAH